MEEKFQHIQLLSISENKDSRAYRIDAGKLSLHFWRKKRIFRVNVLDLWNVMTLAEDAPLEYVSFGCVHLSWKLDNFEK